jgi:hypothetical protein
MSVQTIQKHYAHLVRLEYRVKPVKLGDAAKLTLFDAF